MRFTKRALFVALLFFAVISFFALFSPSEVNAQNCNTDCNSSLELYRNSHPKSFTARMWQTPGSTNYRMRYSSDGKNWSSWYWQNGTNVGGNVLLTRDDGFKEFTVSNVNSCSEYQVETRIDCDCSRPADAEVRRSSITIGGPGVGGTSGFSPTGIINSGTQNISWDAVSNATRYSIRINDETENADFTYTNPPCVGTDGDTCDDNVSTNSYSYNFIAGHSYEIWVHARDCAGAWGAATTFNVSVHFPPPIDKNLTVNEDSPGFVSYTNDVAQIIKNSPVGFSFDVPDILGPCGRNSSTKAYQVQAMSSGGSWVTDPTIDLTFNRNGMNTMTFPITFVSDGTKDVRVMCFDQEILRIKTSTAKLNVLAPTSTPTKTQTPTPTPTPTNTPTLTNTPTSTSIPPTNAPVPTNTLAPTETPTTAPILTPTPTNTAAPTPEPDACPDYDKGNATCDFIEENGIRVGIINESDYVCWYNEYVRKSLPGVCKTTNFDSSEDGVTILDFVIWQINFIKTHQTNG